MKLPGRNSWKPCAVFLEMMGNSRMQSQGLPGQIQISESTYQLIKDEFICEPRGSVNVKGKGEMEVWLVISARKSHQK